MKSKSLKKQADSILEHSSVCFLNRELYWALKMMKLARASYANTAWLCRTGLRCEDVFWLLSLLKMYEEATGEY